MGEMAESCRQNSLEGDRDFHRRKGCCGSTMSCWMRTSAIGPAEHTGVVRGVTPTRWVCVSKENLGLSYATAIQILQLKCWFGRRLKTLCTTTGTIGGRL